MFWTRLLSGIVLVALSIVLIVCGGTLLFVAAFLISSIGMFELYRVFQMEKSSLAVAGYLANACYYAQLQWHILAETMMLLLAFLIVLMFLYVFFYPRYRAIQIMAAFFGLFYVGVMLSYVLRLRLLPGGMYLAFLVFLCSWGCDTCAYCVGKLIGKHKMSPVLSPNKSMEGAVGGVLGSALLTALYSWIFRGPLHVDPRQIGILAVIAAIAGAVSMVGDLCASAIKRNYDIKDYGKLIPGHGGVLDRFDSMIITAPIIFYLAENVLMTRH